MLSVKREHKPDSLLLLFYPIMFLTFKLERLKRSYSFIVKLIILDQRVNSVEDMYLFLSREQILN